MDPNQKIIESQ